LNDQGNNFVSHDILSKNLWVCNQSNSCESNHVIPNHETLFDAFPFGDMIFGTHFEKDHVLSNETLLEDKYCEENILDLHNITLGILLPQDHSKESEKEDSWNDVASCDRYFEDMVEDHFVNACQDENIVWPNECVNKEIQVEHLCFDNEHDTQTPSLCYDDDLTNQSISHVQNTTFLETIKQIQPRYRDLSQIFHSYTCDEEDNYAK
jgi:hypothetical protein